MADIPRQVRFGGIDIEEEGGKSPLPLRTDSSEQLRCCCVFKVASNTEMIDSLLLINSWLL